MDSKIHIGHLILKTELDEEIKGEVFFPSIDYLPTVIINFGKDVVKLPELTSNSQITSMINNLLKQIGFTGPFPKSFDFDGELIFADDDSFYREFIRFAENTEINGQKWINLSRTENKKLAAKSVLARTLGTAEENIKELSDEVLSFRTDKYIVIESERVASRIKDGIKDNIVDFDSGDLAPRVSSKLAPSIEDRENKINEQKGTLSKSEFGDWIYSFIEPNSFYAGIYSEIPSEEIYSIALNAKLIKNVDCFSIFKKN